MKKILHKILKFFAKRILKKYKPQIIGITGSVGKTSTKEAIFTVLKAHKNVRQNIKNYNNEIGVPLTIIGATTAGKNIFKWITIFIKAIWMIIFKQKDYPEILVLEMGVDRPGDLQYLVKMAPCNVGVVTTVGTVHAEFLGSAEEIAKEKELMSSHLGASDYAILNRDDERVFPMAEKTKAQVITYGFEQGADAFVSEIKYSQTVKNINGEKVFGGISFKVSYQGSVVPVFLPNVLGKQQVYAVLPAVAIGVIYGMNLIEISEALRNYEPPKGRMRVLEGIKHTLIIDDSYNAEPLSTKAALDVLTQLELKKDQQKFAVLGDMLELGQYSEEKHRDVGRFVAENKIDYLVAVGERSIDMADEARKSGMSEERVYTFDNSEEAGRFVQDRLEKGDAVLIKGSQGVRMEKIVKELMAEPLRASELLVRQEGKWLKK